MNGTNTFNIDRLPLCGDVASNPGPRKPTSSRFPCKEFGKRVRSNQDAILCVDCNCWTHTKCLNQLKKAYTKSSALRRINRLVPTAVMIRLYKAFVLPHFEYCNPPSYLVLVEFK